MKKKLALWIGLAVFSIAISDPSLAAFACGHGRMRQARFGAPMANSGGFATAPVQPQGFVTYTRPSASAPWRATGSYNSFDDAVRAMQNAQSQGIDAFVGR